MINYPFVFPSAKENAPDVFKNIGAAKYPAIEAGQESKPPLGGINIGVSAYSKNKDVAFEAIECLIKPENQLEIAKSGGLPPVREDLYDRPEIEEIYPGFAEVIRNSIRDAAPRPSQSPAYQDLALAIMDALHPVGSLEGGSGYEKLRDNVEKAIKREGLL
jgi:multiple sugar transport system substrate-binding protein